MSNLSQAVLSAKAIRSELKKGFPGVKFSVRSKTFSGGDAVYVRWIDGPARDLIQSILDKYQEGDFNTLRDIYELKSRGVDTPTVKYVVAVRD